MKKVSTVPISAKIKPNVAAKSSTTIAIKGPSFDCFKSLSIDFEPGNLKIYTETPKKSPNKKYLGINPGASYGSSKRWYAEEFADLAKKLAQYYEIIIFGGQEDKNIANEIEQLLISKGVKNYSNLAGKTDVKELIIKISTLNLFVTGDSGPMHIAASFKIPTISIFGPTRHEETSQWRNEKSIIVKKNLSCQPCMQRVCPLGHHKCMKFLDSRWNKAVSHLC